MDHVSGTERLVEPSSPGCKSLCPPRSKAPVQPGVGERRRSPPSDRQLGAGSRRSQVGALGQGAHGFGEWRPCPGSDRAAAAGRGRSQLFSSPLPELPRSPQPALS